MEQLRREGGGRRGEGGGGGCEFKPRAKPGLPLVTHK